MLTVLYGIMMAVGICACGGDSDDDNNGGNGGGHGGNDISTVSIIGTWRYYFESNDPNRGRVYDQITFNSDHTGYLIEEVGYGSDHPNYFTWTQTGNTISVKYTAAEDVVDIIQITEIIDNNTVVITVTHRNKQKTYTCYRDNGDYTPGGEEDNTPPTEEGLPWDWTSDRNLWKPVYDSQYEPYIFYMPGWEWNDGYSYKLDGDEYSLFLPLATDGDWQAQMIFYTEIAAYQSYAYNFYCVLESNVRHPGVRLMLREDLNDDNNFFNETVPLNAHEPYIFMKENVRLPLANAAGLTLHLELSNNAANDTIKMSKVCLELAR